MYRGVLVIWGLISAVAAEDPAVVRLASLVDCSDSTSMIYGIKKCLELYDVPISLPDPEIFANSSTSSAATLSFLRQIDTNTTMKLCRPENRENYIKGSVCVYYIVKKCSAGTVIESLIPTPEKVRKQISFQCRSSGQFNQDCVVSKIEDIQDCVNVSTVMRGDAGNSTDEDFLSRTICVSFELTRLCARKHLKSCGQATLQLYEQTLPAPDVCKNYTDSNLGTDDKEAVDCSSTWGVRKSYLTCQINSGIFLPLPEMDSSAATSQYILKTVTLDSSKTMCRTMSEASDLLNCTLSVQRECSSDNLKQTVPDTESVLKGFQQLCENIDGFDAECITNMTEAACRERKRRSISDRTILKHLCQDTLDHNKCLVDSVKSCGVETSSAYDDILSAQLPQMCLQTDTPTTDNSAFQPTLSVLVFLLPVILLH